MNITATLYNVLYPTGVRGAVLDEMEYAGHAVFTPVQAPSSSIEKPYHRVLASTYGPEKSNVPLMAIQIDGRSVVVSLEELKNMVDRMVAMQEEIPILEQSVEMYAMRAVGGTSGGAAPARKPSKKDKDDKRPVGFHGHFEEKPKNTPEAE